MKILILLTTLLLTTSYAGDKIIDSIGYRYSHDMNNEHDGSKFRAYITKDMYKNKFKFAYERQRTGTGLESGTWFIDHSIKF
jgi:hypothetical protein